MIIFSEEFWKSDGKPIIYKGKTIAMWDRFPVPLKEIKIKYRIISTDSEWKQGVAVKTKGTLVFDTDNVLKKGWMLIWEDISPLEDEFICRSKNGLLDVKNIWDTGNGVVESWINGAAMWYEEIPNGRRYHCNDGHFDDDFNDIIFELTVVDEVK
jgi:hypothetical protein